MFLVQLCCFCVLCLEVLKKVVFTNAARQVLLFVLFVLVYVFYVFSDLTFIVSPKLVIWINTRSV